MFQVKSACRVEVLASGQLHPSPVKSEGRQGESMIRWLVSAIGLSLVASHAVAADPIEIGIGYLSQAGVKSKLSLVEQPPGTTALPARVSRSTTTTRLASSSISALPWKRFVSRTARMSAARQKTLAGRNGFIIAVSCRRAVEGRRRAPRQQNHAVECRIHRRPAARAGLPRQCNPRRPDPLDARRRSRPVSGVEAVEAMAAGGWFT